MAIQLEKLTRNIEVKKQLTEADKLDILKQISEAEKIAADKQDEIAGLQESIKGLKEAVAVQHDTISELCVKYRLGYESKWTECTAIYKDGEATFLDKDGVIVEQRPMTEAEQLQLTEHRIDAEDIVRNSSENED